MTDLSQAIWRKANRSAHNGGCVEVAANLVDEGGAHLVDRAAFARFLADVRRGRYDI